jgi:hypothetical protein
MSSDEQKTESFEAAALEEKVKANVANMNTWLRIVFVALFALIFYIVFFITCAVGVIQFIAGIFTGKPLASLTDFNGTLAVYAQDLVKFITYSSEKKPFPFKE